MQKNLLTHPSALYSLLQGIYSRNNTQLVAGITFLLTVLSSLSVAAQIEPQITASYVKISGLVGGQPFELERRAALRPAGDFTPLFQSSTLGIYDQAYNSTTNVSTSDSLYIDGEATTVVDTSDNVQSVQMLYRVFRSDGTGEPGVALPLSLALQSGVTTGGSATWKSLTSRTNLLNSTTGPGNYTVVVYFQAGISSSDKTKSTIDDNRGRVDANLNPQGYRASFNLRVNGSFYVSRKWLGNSGDKNWFTAANWENGRVPDSNTDVEIPIVSTGYPTISDGQGSALVHNLQLNSKPNKFGGAIRAATLTLSGSQLYIYGNLADAGGGLSQLGGLLSFSGRRDQTIQESVLFTVTNVEMTGGGDKTLGGVMTVTGTLTFSPTANGPSGKLVTGVIGNNQSSSVVLDTDARLVGEHEEGYLDGIVRINRLVAIGRNNFGNIGLDLNAKSGVPGSATITRYSNIYTGTGSSVSIARGFTIEPRAPLTTQDFDLVFHYLKADLNGITTDNLRLYRSDDGEISFQALGLGTTSIDTVAKTLTVPSISSVVNSNAVTTFTLGNVENPLPVKLVSFTAIPTAEGAALLHWLTASELNNKGFAIERQLSSTDSWQQVGYVAAGKTPKGNTYGFTDKSLIVAPVSTQAYYRLRQEDYNGVVSYSQVAVITRKPGQLGSDLVLSPVPVDGTNLSVAFAEANQAGVEITVINTQGQNVLRLTTAASGNPAVSLPVTSLAAGMYILRVQAPGQAVRHARFVKL